MGRLGKKLLVGVAALAGVLAIAVTLTIGWCPLIGPKARPLSSRTFQHTPQRLERGRYIATALSGCLYCHSHHDWTAPGTPIVPGTEGAGEIQPEADLPGRIVAPNLTPDPETGAGNWTDDQLARSIREGIGHDGRALFPMMPYTHYREMSDEDVASANLTPDPTGIPYYDEALFLQVMHTGYVKARALNAIMPVSVYKNLTDSDLKDMFAYLRTLKSVK